MIGRDCFLRKYFISNVCSSCGTDVYEVLQHEVETSKEKILEWKAHILRSVHQDSAKTDRLKQLKPHQAVVIMDWAMKFLPARFRETQTEWYGKKGRSWHISVVITKEDEDFEVKEFCPIGLYYPTEVIMLQIII